MSHSVANREQAKLCIERARTEMKRLRYAKAVKFLEKALRMNPDDVVAKRELSEARNKLLDSNNNNNSSRSSTPRMKRTESKQDESKVEPPKMKRRQSSKSGTKEECRRINNCKDYYTILGVSRTADSKTIRMAYRKLARKFHPDKNNNEKEYTEAFKAIGQAYDTLSDDEKRAHYDRFGAENAASNPRAQYARRYHHEFRTADDIFNSFFGGQHPIFATHHRRGQQFNQQGNGRRGEPNNLGALGQFDTGMGSGSSRTEMFRFAPSVEYSSKRVTSNRHIDFYVSENIDRDISRNRFYRAQVESKVETKYYHQLKSRCKSEKSQKRKEIRNFIRQKDDAKLEKARKKALRNCDRLVELFPESSRMY